MATTVLIAGVLILTMLVLQQGMTRKRWRRMRQRVAMTLETDMETLARKHPIALQDELCNARECEVIHHAFAEGERGRERDRASAKAASARTTRAVEKLHEALRLSVARRVGQGVVTPASKLEEQPEAAR